MGGPWPLPQRSTHLCCESLGRERGHAALKYSDGATPERVCVRKGSGPPNKRVSRGQAATQPASAIPPCCCIAGTGPKARRDYDELSHTRTAPTDTLSDKQRVGLRQVCSSACANRDALQQRDGCA